MFSTNYTIKKTQLRSNVPDRSADVDFVLGQDIESCFSSDLLSEFNLKSTTFDYFIEWQPYMTSGTLHTDIWFKRSLNLVKDNDKINCNDIITIKDKFAKVDTLEYITDTNTFFVNSNLNPRYMVIKDIPDKFIKKNLRLDNNRIINVPIFNDSRSLCFSYPVSNNFTSKDLRLFTLTELQKELVKNSGRPFKMSKDLTFSQTYLECYLAYTAEYHGGTWPGDCDLLLYDSDFKCICILEFKKCTNYGKSISIENQSFKNYREDETKYKRLGILREHFENVHNKSVPIITIFYPSKSRKEYKIKLEVINGDHKELTPGKSKLLNIPTINNSDTLNEFKHSLLQDILSLI